MNSSGPQTSLLLQVGLAAATSAVGLFLLQTDTVSRYLLNAEKLRSKRKNEYMYRWQQALDVAKLKIQYARAGGIQYFSEEQERYLTSHLDSEEDIQHLVEQIYSGEVPFQVLRIGKDATDVYLWIGSSGSSTQYQVQLQVFVAKMEDALDRHVTTTTFCFVSDASGGVASTLIGDLARQCFPETAVAVMSTPVWLVQLSVLVEEGLLSSETIELVISCLCRLQARAFRNSKNVSTVLFTIPMSVVPILARWLQRVFPDDRHVFCYTGCISAIEYALALRVRDGSERGIVPTFENALLWNNSVATTTPLAKQGVETSSNIMRDSFVESLAGLPISYADIAESWIAAVDTFFVLKENEKFNSYMPYVCKLDNLLGSSKEPVKEGSDRYWSLRSLLQYLTGNQNRDLSSEMMDAASSLLEDFSPSRITLALTPMAKRAIDNAVFQHKLILIENKTLLDTVQPSKHWTLKAAGRKGGCSCCAPEEDEDEAETAPDASGAQFARRSAADARRINMPSTGYVDGKTMFAFDPTRFS
jgi:hypothetical protein